MREDIVVIGGYGQVGRAICSLLARRYAGRVYAAGRNFEKANRFSLETDGEVQPLQVDIHQPKKAFEALNQPKVVIVCIDQDHTEFARLCAKNGIDYLDITANGKFLKELGGLNRGAVKHTGVISVGLAPGITNLLVEQAVRMFEQVHQVDISILLGLGDEHGEGAMEWTFQQINQSFDVMVQNDWRQVKSFTDRQQVSFGKAIGNHSVYRFPFSDQQTLARTLHLPTVSTRLCFDSRLVTAVVATMRRLHITKLLSLPAVRKVLTTLLNAFPYGSEQYGVRVEVKGVRKDEKEEVYSLFTGENEALMTAHVASAVAFALYEHPCPKGVFHIEELFELVFIDQHISLTLKGTEFSYPLPTPKQFVQNETSICSQNHS
ncbi:saccharopine dehydrogenase family protein [Halalkalibacterium halodurans]|uniref:saccharopine dehydrogenase family protein n=1 Tax=Halalkalibacterium halodurans TaxID=86665 RepID=UPI002E21833C|nr:saccharopine dehydrogenase family protein [Halalkalibacterium halodurans]